MDSTTLSGKRNISTKSAEDSEQLSFSLNLTDRGTYYREVGADCESIVSAGDITALDDFDLIYRTLCAVMFNYTGSGHPGGSVSSGRIVQSLLFESMLYDFQDPDKQTADLLCYTAGHKAMGLYAMWACRDEVMRQSQPDSLPAESQRLRLEDLLGFRKNPITRTPLFLQHKSKPLDGHPTPQTPFVSVATGPSGVGVTAAVGLALALKDLYGAQAPVVNMIEGEGGLTPGRVSEALAAAASAELDNIILHVDWNQAAIDSDAVTREGKTPGDYAQWDPRELLLTHGFNVINVADGFDYQQNILAQRQAQEQARKKSTTAPTAIVYRTTKGWHYGIEGSKSHGAGHKFCSEQYYAAVKPFEERFGITMPRFKGDKTPETTEESYYQALMTIRSAFEATPELTGLLGDRVKRAADKLRQANRSLRRPKPTLEALYSGGAISPAERPERCLYASGKTHTLRGALADTFNEINLRTTGAILSTSADVFGSTNTTNIGAGFPSGLWRATSNPDSRIFASGGITEDAIGGICSGISTIGEHIGVGASYGAFIAPLTVISSRTHGIGQQTLRHRHADEPFKTMVTVCGHTGIKTGEDGPTHAEPNTLQIFQENFPQGIVITLTPWDPNELWPLTVAALQKRPAVLVPYVTRPGEMIFDRPALGLAPAEDSIKGVYKLLSANGQSEGTVVYQGSDVANVFVKSVLPQLQKSGLNLDVYYIASAEMFDLLPDEERQNIYADDSASSAMMITGFTRPTTYRWITSAHGRRHTLYALQDGAYLGSGVGDVCLEQAGLGAAAQLSAIESFVSSS